MPKLLYQGHASLRLVSDKGVVLYVDPCVGDGYDLPADIVLITHPHDGHSQLHLVTQKAKCQVITAQEAQTNGIYNAFRIRRVTIRATPAFNEAHDPREGVGYIIFMDGVRIYVAGDTSETDAMTEMFFQRLDYAILPIDGVHNMDPVNASICAATIGARHSIPYHTHPERLYDLSKARRFDVPGRILLQPGEEIDLTGSP